MQGKSLVTLRPVALFLAGAILVAGCSNGDAGNATSAGRGTQPETVTTTTATQGDGQDAPNVTDATGGNPVESQGTTVEDDGGKDAGDDRTTNLTEDMIPPVGELPNGYSMEGIAKAIVTNMSDKHPNLGVRSVELLGSSVAESDEPENGDGFWASYLVRDENGGRIGLEVTYSADGTPIVGELRLLRTGTGQLYDVSADRYVNQDEAAEIRETASDDYDSDPSHGYNESNPAPHTSVLVSDDQGNMVWVTQKGDLG